MTKQDKWKVASHFQKAIRHGRPDDAEQGVRWLAELDPAYLRYRLAVIAVEDVAAGSPEIVAASFSGGWTKADIASRGGDEFLVAQARQWAESVKDRTPCDWLSCTRYRAEFEKKWGPWELLSLRKARSMAFDLECPWWARGLAAWRAAGANNLKSGHLPALPGDWEAFVDEAANQGLSDAWLTCMKVGGKVQGEGHPIFIPLAAKCQAMEPVVIVSKPVPQLGYAGPWLSAALDKHTSEGKKALSRLLRQQPSAVQSLMANGAAYDTVEDLVGRLWFWMEGGRLDCQKTYQTATAIDLESKRLKLMEAGISGKALFEAFGQNLAAWHAARESAIGFRPIFAPSP